MRHQWRSGRGTDFKCTTLYGALEQYRWPDNRNALDYRVTTRRLREFRLNLEHIGAIDSRVKQTKFVDNAQDIFRWGSIRQRGKLNEWRSMPPRQEPKRIRYHRCDRPKMNSDSAAYACDNLKTAWLLAEMVREPGEFEQVGFAPVDALQQALFMVGYASLPDNAIQAA